MTYEHAAHIPEAGASEFDPVHAPSGHNVPMRVEMVPTGELVVDPQTVRIFSRFELKTARRVIKRAGVRIAGGRTSSEADVSGVKSSDDMTFELIDDLAAAATARIPTATVRRQR